jgi:hypothetical protein
MMMFIAVTIVRRSRAGRLLCGDQREAFFFDIEARLVDHTVGGLHFPGLFDAECIQCLQRQFQFFGHATAHQQNIIAQFTQSSVKIGTCRHDSSSPSTIPLSHCLLFTLHCLLFTVYSPTFTRVAP